MLSVFISGCATTVKIASVVEKEPEGDFLLKWEVSPDREGIIDIYSSSTDSILEDFTPLTSADVSDQVMRLNPTGTGLREFFILRIAGCPIRSSIQPGHRDGQNQKFQGYRGLFHDR